VSHLDLYRFEGMSEEEWGDLEPYFDDAIVFVEWPDAGLRHLPQASHQVTLEHRGADARLITIHGGKAVEDGDSHAHARV
jgi:tRNA A37 threonylcarbamoyladenosine biosynthesis protein TsaE